MKKSLPYPSPEAHEVLWNLKYIDKNNTYQAIPLKVDGESIVFKLTSLQEVSAPGSLKRWLISLRAISLTSMFLPVLTVFLFLKLTERAYNPLWAIVCAVIPCLLLLAVNLINDVQDHLRLIDLPGTNGGSGVIQKGWITPKQLTFMAYALIIIAFLLAIPVLLSNSILLTLILPLTLISVIGYSGKPFNFKYTATGDLIVFLCCGPLLIIGYSLAVFNFVNYQLLFLGFFYGFLACAILHANNLNDITVDKGRGAKTLATAFGFQKSKHILATYYFAAFLSLITFTYMGNLSWSQFSLVMLNIIPISFLLSRVYKASHPDDQIIANIRFTTPQIHLLTGILLCLSLVFLKN